MADTLDDPHRDSPSAIDSAARGLAPGQRFGRYVVMEQLGEGGMGVVWAAWDDRLERRVALKLVRASRADPRDEERMLREARAIAQLNHPHVVAVHDAGVIAGEVFLALELVAGVTLRRWLQRPRTAPEVLEVFLQAGRGLAGAHRAGLVHRDFKPENVLVGDDGRVRVTDFGLARPVDESSAPPTEPLVAGASTLRGTPAYMSPEQIRTGSAGPAADQFAFCVALYEALYGEHPFAPREGGGTDALLTAITAGKLKIPREPARAPATVLAVLTRGLRLDVARRWATMDALLAALPDALEAPRRRRRTALASATGLLVAALAVGGHQLAQRRARVCEGGAEQLRRVWNEARRNEVAAALSGVKTPWAQVAAQAAVRGLDLEAEAWRAGAKEACEATLVFGAQSDAALALRNGCLQRRLEGLDALVAQLTRADEAVAARAVSAVDGLGGLRACADLDALTTVVPGPADPAVAGLQRGLAQTRALAAVGRLDDAAAALPLLAQTADRVGWAPLQAEAFSQQAGVAFAKGELERAVTLGTEALLAAERGRDFDRAADALLDLTFATRKLGRFDEALRYVRRCEALLTARPDPRRLARLSRYAALTLTDAGRADEAVARAQQAVVLAQALGPASLAAALEARADDAAADAARAAQLRTLAPAASRYAIEEHRSADSESGGCGDGRMTADFSEPSTL